jgi:hypothetical protein
MGFAVVEESVVGRVPIVTEGVAVGRAGEADSASWAVSSFDGAVSEASMRGARAAAGSVTAGVAASVPLPAAVAETGDSAAERARAASVRCSIGLVVVGGTTWVVALGCADAVVASVEATGAAGVASGFRGVEPTVGATEASIAVTASFEVDVTSPFGAVPTRGSVVSVAETPFDLDAWITVLDAIARAVTFTWDGVVAASSVVVADVVGASGTMPSFGTTGVGVLSFTIGAHAVAAL